MGGDGNRDPRPHARLAGDVGRSRLLKGRYERGKEVRGRKYNAEVNGVLIEANEVLQEVQEVHRGGKREVQKVHAGGERGKRDTNRRHKT